MTNILLHAYYYRCGEQRKQINNLLATANLTEAKSKLDTALAEHNTKYPIEFLKQRRDFNYGEYLTMEHAKRHLDKVLVDGDISYIDGNTGEPRTQVSKIIQILEHQPTNTDL